MKHWGGCALLLFAAMAWGSGFAVAKSALEALPPCLVLLLRFGGACLALLPFVWKRLRAAPVRTWKVGAAVGLCIFSGHLFQFLGLRFTTAGKSAFLSAVYVVLVPFLIWAAGRRRPTRWNLAAAVLCLVGVGVISLDGGLSIGAGEALTLLGGVGFALQIAALSLYARDCDMLVITFVSMLVSAVCAAVPALLLEARPAGISLPVAGAVVYLAVVCSALSFSAQNTGVRHVPAALATILMSTEAVFGCLTGVLLLHEAVSGRMLLGSGLIVAALLTCDLGGKPRAKNIHTTDL